MTEEEATQVEGEVAEEEVEEEVEEAMDPAEDTLPVLLIGIQAMWGTLVWILTMFLYIGTNDLDKLGKIPLIFSFENLSKSWTAAMYFAYFLGYLIVSVIELVGWILLKMGSPGLALMWTPLIGFWGSIILYVIPPLFAAFQLWFKASGGGLDGLSTAPAYTNALILGFVIGLISWIAHGLIHFLFTDRFVAHVLATMPKGCECTGEAPEEPAEDADEEALAAYEEAVAAYKEACDTEIAECEAAAEEAAAAEEEGAAEEGAEEEAAAPDAEASEGDGW